MCASVRSLAALRSLPWQIAMAAILVAWRFALAEPLPAPSAADLESAMATIKSIYKDPKFLNKTGKSRDYSSYSDEDDG